MSARRLRKRTPGRVVDHPEDVPGLKRVSTWFPVGLSKKKKKKRASFGNGCCEGSRSKNDVRIHAFRASRGQYRDVGSLRGSTSGVLAVRVRSCEAQWSLLDDLNVGSQRELAHRPEKGKKNGEESTAVRLRSSVSPSLLVPMIRDETTPPRD